MDNTDILLSIVIPVFNTDKYINTCLERINKMRVKKEIICIDDGSWDNSNQSLLLLAQKYPEILLVSQTNRGVSEARNVGISFARGKYLLFVDSDDLIDEVTIAKAVAMLENEELDAISFGYNTIGDMDATQITDQTFNDLTDYNISNFVHKTCVWQKIYKRRIIEQNNILFPDIKYGEDAFFGFLVIPHLKRIKNINLIGYHYRINNDSTMHRVDRYIPWFNDTVTVAVLLLDQQKKEERKAVKEALCMHKNLFVLQSLTCGLHIRSYSADEIIGLLQKNGLYPTPPMWRLLYFQNDLKTTITNIIRFPFFCKYYYKVFLNLFRFFNNNDL